MRVTARTDIAFAEQTLFAPTWNSTKALKRKAIETTEIEARLARLETAQEGITKSG